MDELQRRGILGPQFDREAERERLRSEPLVPGAEMPEPEPPEDDGGGDDGTVVLLRPPASPAGS